MENTASAEGETYPQQPLWLNILLSLLPGVLITVGFLILRPIVTGGGFPPLTAFLLAVLLVGIPVLVGIMLFEGYRLHNRLTLEGVVLYRQPIPTWQYFVIVPVAFIAGMLVISFLGGPLNLLITRALFGWLPDWVLLNDPNQYTPIDRAPLWITFILRLLITGLALPIVEELYFRGYLLPRISRFNFWAPLIGAILFALYHIWSPYEFITVLALGLLLSYLAWWKRNVYLTIILHLFANFLLAFLAMLLFFIYP